MRRVCFSFRLFAKIIYLTQQDFRPGSLTGCWQKVAFRSQRPPTVPYHVTLSTGSSQHGSLLLQAGGPLYTSSKTSPLCECNIIIMSLISYHICQIPPTLRGKALCKGMNTRRWELLRGVTQESVLSNPIELNGTVLRYKWFLLFFWSLVVLKEICSSLNESILVLLS